MVDSSFQKIRSVRFILRERRRKFRGRIFRFGPWGGRLKLIVKPSDRSLRSGKMRRRVSGQFIVTVVPPITFKYPILVVGSLIGCSRP